jgi:glycosyltransferase involved in cell wall biosynthesis
MKSVAVIPAYNEERTIGDVVRQTLKYVDEVVVVNDHSTDDTDFEVLRTDAALMVASVGRGAGKAIKDGINNALFVFKPDVIILLDGDGQHNPDDIPDMLALLKNYDMVVTSRFMGDGLTKVPKYRRFGIWAITLAYNFGAKFKVRDSQCGLRAFRAEVLRSMDLQENGFGYSTEMLVKARAKGYRIIEIPTIVTYHPNFRQNSSMNPVIHGIGVLLCTIKWRIKAEVFGCFQ